MCFYIAENDLKLTAKLKKSKNPIVAWKVVCGASSIYRSYNWKRGNNFSGRLKSNISSNELRDRAINEGFHFFTARKSAREFKVFGGGRVIRCIIRPKDVVCTNGYQMVATKCFTNLRERK